jgi:transcriptional regulator with XRE-family HTH domain
MALDTETIPEWTLGDRMAKARTWAGIEQGEMCQYLEVSRNTISGWENDRHPPSRAVLIAYALRCQVPLWWLEDSQAPPESPPPPKPPRRPRKPSSACLTVDELRPWLVTAAA